jgi:F-type H+-transporting ATPase subunit gamma
MAERLADVVTQLHNVRQLEEVVTAMRGIAASRAQQSRSLLGGVQAYAEVVSRAIGRALSLLPPDLPTTPARRRAKRGLILFCAEQGFAGAFSERVLDAAAGDVDDATSLIIGTRGAAIASERGIKSAWSAPMAAHARALPSFANQLADALYGYVGGGAVVEVDVVFPRSVSGTGIQIDRYSLLPIDFRRFAQPIERQAPLTTLAPQPLLERLAAEYIYAQLCEAAMLAFEAENEARMMAMTAAKTNIAPKLNSLSSRERQLRQEEITTEIVELAAGSEALTKASTHARRRRQCSRHLG